MRAVILPVEQLLLPILLLTSPLLLLNFGIQVNTRLVRGCSCQCPLIALHAPMAVMERTCSTMVAEYWCRWIDGGGHGRSRGGRAVGRRTSRRADGRTGADGPGQPQGRYARQKLPAILLCKSGISADRDG